MKKTLDEILEELQNRTSAPKEFYEKQLTQAKSQISELMDEEIKKEALNQVRRNLIGGDNERD